MCRNGRELPTLDAAVQALVRAAEDGDADEARRLLHELVLEYSGV
jgi:hypothetical protein